MTVRPSSKLPRLIAPLAILLAALALVVVVVTSLDLDGAGPAAAPDAGVAEIQEDPVAADFGGNYEVQLGDSLSTIAEETGVPVDVLSQLNPDLDPQTLNPGDKVKLR